MKVLTNMRTGVYTKMCMQIPTKVEVFCAKRTTAHGKKDSAHKNVHKSVLSQFSQVLNFTCSVSRPFTQPAHIEGIAGDV